MLIIYGHKFILIIEIIELCHCVRNAITWIHIVIIMNLYPPQLLIRIYVNYHGSIFDIIMSMNL